MTHNTPQPAKNDPPSTEALVQVRGLAKSFSKNGQVQVVLDHIDIDIDEGEFLLILGESGCGKTTFLNILGAIDNPDEGEIGIREYGDVLKFNDVDLSSYRNRMIGHVFQTFNLKKNYTVYENVRVPLLFSGVSRRDAHERISEAIHAVGLDHRTNHRPAELSEGQAQRVAIARAIVNHPRILLADEPTGNLDIKTSASIMELMLQIKNERKTSLVMVGHDPKVVSLTDRVVVLDQGKFHQRSEL